MHHRNGSLLIILVIYFYKRLVNKIIVFIWIINSNKGDKMELEKNNVTTFLNFIQGICDFNFRFFIYYMIKCFSNTVEVSHSIINDSNLSH